MRIDDTDTVQFSVAAVECRVRGELCTTARLWTVYAFYIFYVLIGCGSHHLRGRVHLIENIYERFAKTKMAFLIARTIHGISWRVK